MRADTYERAERRLAELAARGSDAVTFFREAQEVLLGAVPSVPLVFWNTLDPFSLLLTGGYDHEGREKPHEVLMWEYLVDDVMKTLDAVRSTRGVLTLEEASGGDPTSTTLHRTFLEPSGLEHCVEATFRARSGHTWGSVTLFRERGAPGFGRHELDLLEALAPELARGVQRGLLIGEATDPEWSDSPGLVVFDARWTPITLTSAAERWITEIAPGWTPDREPPAPVLAVAANAMGAETQTRVAERHGDATIARVRAPSGGWFSLHGVVMVVDGCRRAAAIIEPAHPARIVPLLMAAYELTAREQQVTSLVLRGASTRAIATTLRISVHTVQEHLKHVFDKVDVRSRRDLVGRVFFAHYEPRVRDNERRVAVSSPHRGGPFPSAAATPTETAGL